MALKRKGRYLRLTPPAGDVTSDWWRPGAIRPVSEVGALTPRRACFKAGVAATRLVDDLNSAYTWVEYGDASNLRTSFWHVATKAGNLYTALQGRARQAAAELAAHAQKLQKGLKLRRSLKADEQSAFLGEIHRMKDRSHWLWIAARAQCDDPEAKASMRRYKPPALTGPKGVRKEK